MARARGALAAGDAALRRGLPARGGEPEVTESGAPGRSIQVSRYRKRLQLGLL